METFNIECSNYDLVKMMHLQQIIGSLLINRYFLVNNSYIIIQLFMIILALDPKQRKIQQIIGNLLLNRYF